MLQVCGSPRIHQAGPRKSSDEEQGERVASECTRANCLVLKLQNRPVLTVKVLCSSEEFSPLLFPWDIWN